MATYLISIELRRNKASCILPSLVQSWKVQLLVLQVLELWPQWVAAGLVANPHFHTAAVKFLNVLASNLHSVASRRTHAPLVSLPWLSGLGSRLNLHIRQLNLFRKPYNVWKHALWRAHECLAAEQI